MATAKYSNRKNGANISYTITEKTCKLGGDQTT